jgi:hypothetical protein
MTLSKARMTGRYMVGSTDAHRGATGVEPSGPPPHRWLLFESDRDLTERILSVCASDDHGESNE